MSLPSNTQAVDWESRYRDGATGWERPGPNPAFLAWREAGLLKPCRILVPGAGRSIEPLVMAQSGFDVTVVEGAEAAAATQRERFERLALSARVERADLFLWDPDERFDAIYDQTCLCALPPGTWPNYADRLHRWLFPGGSLFVLFMQTETGGGPPFHCDLARMRVLFPDSRWVWTEPLPALIAHSPGRAEQPAILRKP
ncbi:MAG: methyltransferase domain-containing protein [Acetobacteraceae bacterium]|nr:methyltransferase domain-containing protein [Acetobacteraceae bacterium]